MLRTRIESARAVQPANGMKFMMMGVLLAVGGTIAASAWAQPSPPVAGSAPHHEARHHGPRGGGFGGAGVFRGGPEQVDRGVDRLLRGLNATEAQRSQIKQIARAAAVDLRAQRAASRGLHEQGLQLFAAPVVDARAVETLRQQRLAQHDQASKRITQALLEVSAVLSPEQRGQLAARMKAHQERMKKGAHERHQHRSLERRGAASAPTQ